VCTFCTSTPLWTVPAHTAVTPWAPAVAATAMASRTFCGPSGESAVAGRIAQVSTTGFAGANTE
jgi:hypothetical protein